MYKWRRTQCGNYANSLSHFFYKNFFKATPVLLKKLLKKLLKSWFDEIFLQWERILRFSTLCDATHSVEKREILSRLTWKIFRQINPLVTYLVKRPLLSRNFCQKCVRENSRNFHSVASKMCHNVIFYDSLNSDQNWVHEKKLTK